MVDKRFTCYCLIILRSSTGAHGEINGMSQAETGKISAPLAEDQSLSSFLHGALPQVVTTLG